MNLIGYLRGIRALCEVDAHGSYSAAADALGLTQSAVSQHLAALERETGLPLVERGTRPAALTEAGYALVRHGRAVLGRLDAAALELAEIAGRRAARLRFGSFPTALTTFVPAAIARLRTEHPTVALSVVDDHMQGLLPRLVDGELDLAVIFDHATLPETAADGLRRIHLFDDRYQVLLPAGHRLARRRRTLGIADLAEEVWIGGRAESVWFQIVRHACRGAGFEPRTSLASDDYRAVQAFVAAGLGVAVVPGLAARHAPPGVAVFGLGAGAPVRRICVAHVEDGFQPQAARAMTGILQNLTGRPASRVSAAPAAPPRT
ncbi:LysR family transcriptional regulator [Solwaraspora sp. WMMD1047]|uniref:LysR family transcriptional regulator n=1 Tax=Solwaraspora sp. WMMD1047 TaxID=3016102 RepID=UPI0024179C84|nr:LysR family transcriptional regulator [Solwaraspora sp. WMMD1047]MDG4830077.1 LysR family transcriptional regulator [Solwaraspora sp. WMMD1047]